MDIGGVVERTLSGLGYELVDLERQRGLLRVFIDKADGVNVDDCALVSNQLTRVFEVEGIGYDRLEVSSPGLDRPLRKLGDFLRFRGEEAHIKVRIPRGVQRNFTGRLCAGEDGRIGLTRDGATEFFELHEIDKARLVPSVGKAAGKQIGKTGKAVKSGKAVK